MRTLTWCLAWSLSVVVTPAAMAQDRGLAIEYTVKVADIPGQLFHVTTDIKNINQPALDLSLPVWSPRLVRDRELREERLSLQGH
jgi:hypothetical protein